MEGGRFNQATEVGGLNRKTSNGVITQKAIEMSVYSEFATNLAWMIGPGRTGKAMAPFWWI
jgi:hypothetical protein